MSNEQTTSKGKLKYYSPQANPKCPCCPELLKKVDTVLEILAEHKILLERIASKNVETEKLMLIFPVTSEEKLKELDDLIAMHPDPYIRQIKNLIGGNVERNLHLVLSHYIIMNFNIEGNFGKKRLRDFGNVLAAIIDVISTFNNEPDKTLRAAFQRQKKKYFKQNSRNNSNNKPTENVQEI